jgi:prevent-host-death family protein
MRTIEVADATQTLAEYARAVGAPVAITEKGKPIAVLLPVREADLETVSLSMSPKFWSIMQRSAARHQLEGGLTPDEVRARLGLPPSPVSKTKAKRKARKTGRVSAR